jgi:hypothetical protein
MGRRKDYQVITAAAQINLEDLLPIPDGAKLVHLAESTVRGHLSAKRLTRFYVGRRVLVSRAELAQFVRMSVKIPQHHAESRAQ